MAELRQCDITRMANAEKRGYYHSVETKQKIGKANSIALKGHILL